MTSVKNKLIMVLVVRPSPRKMLVNTVNTTIPTAKASNLPGQTCPARA